MPTIGQLDAPTTNPWGGSYAISGTSTTIVISSGAIPTTSGNACKAIKNYFDRQVANNLVNNTGACSGAGIDITFNR